MRYIVLCFLACNLSATEEIFCTLDLTVWESRVDGLEYAYKNTGTQNNQNLQSFEPDFKFEPGFKLGFGGFLPYDDWQLNALYTFYQTNRHSSASFSFDPAGVPGPGMIAVWTYPAAFSNNNTGARFQSAKNHWRLHSSLLDVVLSRPCQIATYFTATPTFGLRSAWLHQFFQVNYNSGNVIAFGASNQVTVLSSSLNMYSCSNNFGPAFGCSLKWILGKHWDLFGDVSGSFLASHFSVKRSETDLFLNLAGALQTESIHLQSKYWTFRPQGQIALGFCFFDDFRYAQHLVSYHFSAAYETQMWWKQNQLLRYIDTLNTTSAGAYVAPTQGNLIFQGATLEAGFDF